MNLTCWLALVLGVAGGCQEPRKTIELTIAAGGDVPAIGLVVIAAAGGARVVTTTAHGAPGAPLKLPAAVRMNVSSLPNGDVILQATGYDTAQDPVAGGTTTITLPASGAVIIELHCQNPSCVPGGGGGRDGGGPADGGATDGGAGDLAGNDGAASGSDGGPGSTPDGAVAVSPTCGNGRLDPGETCDIARAADLPGACPSDCDDGVPCTRDQHTGDGCTFACEHVEITADLPGDGCCPALADHGTDSDCSASCGNQRVDPGEVCDTAIAGGPGACPTLPACDDADPCTVDALISAGTCAARCVHQLIVRTAAGDACCPVGANATTDEDCPAACGNGVVESGERCDTGIATGGGACPTVISCDDGLPCTEDALVGTGCQATCAHRTIDGPAPGDGCCPAPGLGRAVDADCPAICGNGVRESGENCDVALAPSALGGCPVSCPPPPAACVRYVLQGSAAMCSAACVPVPVATCSATADGCCPAGCTHATDPDCSSACGNGRIDPGEQCDTAIASGPGVCPRSCSDATACTDDLLVDAQTCNAHCVFIPTTVLRDGDGCCPAGAYAGIDADCPAICGNGVVETPWETCDTGTVPGSCPTACPPPGACVSWTRTTGTGCDVRCVRQDVTACISADGCCPAGCDASSDQDCPSQCGNGVVESDETCDRGITAGHAGACPATCADGDACTQDFARGSAESCSRVCAHVRIAACAGGDGCCPAGCTSETDGDCAPVCGDGQVQAGETCDPPSTCPTSCPSDGDPCTVDQLVGAASTCTAACVHIPILRCSGTQRDGCCPTECGAVSDADC